jgi:hypothetical protein
MKRLVGERRAIATSVLAFFTLMWWAISQQLPDAQARMFLALTGCYGIAFWSIAAGYFWGRWYSSGVLMFGMILGAMGLWQSRFDTPFIFLFGMHFLAAFCLWGESMSQLFEGKPGWRERFALDEGAVARLGNAVTRVGVSLPMILIYALAPRPKGMEFPIEMIGAGLAILAVAGIVRMRTWGILAAAAAGTVTALSVVDGVPATTADTWLPTGAPIGVAAAMLLFAAAAPYFAAMGRFVRRV